MNGQHPLAWLALLVGVSLIAIVWIPALLHSIFGGGR